jgi:hypothetical protein
VRTTDASQDLGFSLAPPPDVVLVRPVWLRVTASTATVLWWTAGIITAGCAGMLVVEPLLSRAIVGPLVVVALVAFALATVAQVVATRATGRLLDRDLAARDAVAHAAWLAEPHESVPVLEAVAEELAADAAEAAATAAVRVAAVAAATAQAAADDADAADDPEDVRAAARHAVAAADVAAFAVGLVPGARRPAEAGDETPAD